MPGHSKRTPSGKILDFFDGSFDEPFPADEIAVETDLGDEAIRTGLNDLVGRGLLRTKEIAGSTRVWWRDRSDVERGERSASREWPSDVADEQDSPTARKRLVEQHRQLAQLVTRLDVTDDLDEVLRTITAEARELVGAHQAVTSQTTDQNWAQAINEVSLSEKYEEYADYDAEPDGSGIYSLVCERNEPMRMTQAELESHPAWNAFDDEGDDHPPMDGWLAVPIVGPDGQNQGLIQLSDSYHGEFTEADEAILIQLANVASAAIENARLYGDLRESTERYRTLVETTPECIKTVASDGTLLQMNPAGLEMVEADAADDAIGGCVYDLIAPEDRERFREFNERICRGETGILEFDVVGLDGTRRHMESHAAPLQRPDGTTCQVALTRDVTEQVDRERELERTLDLLEKTERIADVGGWEIDPETTDVFWTEHLFDILELDTDEEPPLDEALDVYHEEDRATVENAVENALDDGEPFDVEARFVTPDGERRWLRVQGAPEMDGDDVVSLRGAAQDVTARKERERALEASNERLEQFAYAASHDLQEPLRMVSSYLQLIERRYGDDLDEDGLEFLAFAVDGADRMRDMIDALLKYSRVETEGGELEPVDLDEVVADVRDDLAVRIEETDAAVEVEPLPVVEGDGRQLRQVFQNLLDNAVEYAGDESPTVEVTSRTEGSTVVVSVSDEGIGIEPDQADRIFDVFQSLHGPDEHEGMGIGLALCERIVERHGGEIWVESEPGAGATFSFTLQRTGDPDG